MGWGREGLILLMLLSASFAAVVEAGNWTSTGSNATDAAAKCAPDVSVYACTGDVVKVVSSDGSTFYKPDGRTVSCPNGAASQMGAECVQLLMPNYCPTSVTCENTAKQNQSAPASSIASNQSAPVSVSTGQQATATGAAKPPATQKETAKGDVVIPAAAPSAVDTSMDNLALVVLLLGALSVGVLFTMFKNSISE